METALVGTETINISVVQLMLMAGSRGKCLWRPAMVAARRHNLRERLRFRKRISHVPQNPIDRQLLHHFIISNTIDARHRRSLLDPEK